MREALVDANVLLRYLTNQPPELAERVAAILEMAEQQRTALVVAPRSLAEVVYVLQSVYQWQRKDIASGLLKLLRAAVLVMLDQAAVEQALISYRDHPRLAFADAYVAALAVERGHGAVVSLDRELRRLQGVRLTQDAAQLLDE